MSNHTPGPWEAKAIDANHFIINASSEAGTVARTSIPLGLDVVTATIRANARLIAAAPELLDACELVIGSMPAESDLTLEVKRRVAAAIAKATR